MILINLNINVSKVFVFSPPNICCGTQLKCLAEVLLMSVTMHVFMEK